MLREAERYVRNRIKADNLGKTFLDMEREVQEILEPVNREIHESFGYSTFPEETHENLVEQLCRYTGDEWPFPCYLQREDMTGR
jgi:hypothetical protein